MIYGVPLNYQSHCHSPRNVLKDKGVVRVYHDEHGPPGEGIQIAWVETVAVLERGSSGRFAPDR